MMLFKITGNELYKILRQKRIYIFLFFPLFFSLFLIYSIKQWNKNNPDRINTIFASDITFSTLDNVLVFIAFFYAIMVVSFILAEDYADGTIKLSLMRPVSRLSVLNAKIIAYYLSVLIFFIVTFAVTFIIAYCFGTHESVMIFSNSQFKEFQGITVPFGEGLKFLATCYFLCAFSVFVLGLIFFFFGAVTGKPSLAITLSIAFFVGSYFYMMMFRNTPYLKFSLWMQFQFLYKSFYIEQWSLPANTLVGFFKQNLLICTIYAAIFYPLTVVSFWRKSILR